jgi:hypothetical protein
MAYQLRYTAEQLENKLDLLDTETKVSCLSNALKGIASGRVVRIDDVSPVKHTMKVIVKGKNLVPYMTPTEKTDRDTTFTLRDDGSLIVNGRPNEKFSGFIYDLNKFNNMLVGGRTYTIGKLGDRNGDINLYIAYINPAKAAEQYFYSGQTFIWDDTYTIKRIYLQVNGKDNPDDFVPFDNYEIWPQIIEGTTIEDGTYIPPVNLTNVKLKKYGKNLITAADFGKYGFKNSAGTETTRFGYKLFLPRGEYILKVDYPVTTKNYIYLVANDTEGNFMSNVLYNSDGTLKDNGYFITHNEGKISVYSPLKYSLNNDAFIYIYDAVENDTEDEAKDIFNKIKIQLETGTTATKYEAPEDYSIHSVDSSGVVNSDIISVYPTTTLLTNNESVIIDVEYNKDINKAFKELSDAIISLGGNV